MKKSRFSEEKIIAVLKQAEAGVKGAELCRKHGISEATLYNWKAKYGSMESSQLRRLKELETENARLKRMYADLSLTHHAAGCRSKKAIAPAQRAELVDLMVQEHGISARLGRSAAYDSRMAHALQRAAHARVVGEPFPARLLDGNILSTLYFQTVLKNEGVTKVTGLGHLMIY